MSVSMSRQGNVKICKSHYDQNKKDYLSYFDQFPYELDHFQKYAIEGIINNKHVLVTAHTGSGKTLPAEFTIKHFTDQGKRVIYTSPIKSLSNQKFHELSKEFPEISFGILTGDIKCNPEADCIIMTTEILRNTLLKENSDDITKFDENRENSEYYQSTSTNILDFQLNIKETVGAIVFDEVHYINDQHRGKVWEECIMLCPEHIIFVMLSATIDRPEMFANWIATTKHKDVWIASTNKRVVPLTHYEYLHIPNGTTKKIKNDKERQLLETISDELREIKTPNTDYKEKNVQYSKKVKNIMDKYRISVSDKQVLNEIVKKLHREDKLPAICFVFSRKKAEEYASSISINLHDGDNPVNDTKKTSKVKQECIQILKTLPNYKEYSDTYEFQFMMNLLEKGIAVHHSGIIPILREMIELLFSKGYIRLLFATETFAVGINMPTKTVLFTSLEKFDGIDNRILFAHEYTQMAGRAGRRGLDTVGHVIHLHNMFDIPEHSSYRIMLSGKPQTLRSKFSIDYEMVLRTIHLHLDDKDGTNISKHVNQIQTFIENSMYNKEYESLTDEIQRECIILEDDIFFSENKDTHNIDINNLMNKYIQMETDKQYHRKRKLDNHIQQMMFLKENIIRTSKGLITSSNFQKQLVSYKKTKARRNELEKKQLEVTNRDEFLKREIENCIQYMIDIHCLHLINDNISFTRKGIFMTCIQEASPNIVGEMFKRGLFENNDVVQMVQLLSCLVNIKIPESYRLYHYQGTDNNLKSKLNTLDEIYIRENKLEMKAFGYTDEEKYFFQYDLIDAVKMWIEAENETQTKDVLVFCGQYKIFSGEFVKAILKINAIALELEKACDLLNLIEIKEILHQIPDYTLKYIATNQSLYV